MAHESHRHQQKQGSLIPTGLSYSDFSSGHQMQHGFEPNSSGLFNLQQEAGMEFLSIPSKTYNNQQQQRDARSPPATLWKGFFPKSSGSHGSPSSSSSPKTLAGETPADFYQPSEFQKPDFASGDFPESSSNENLMVAPAAAAAAWQTNRMLVDDSALRCMFPGIGGDLPSQGLSLSLCNTKPSHVGLPPSFDVREHDLTNLREELFAKAAVNLHPHPHHLQQFLLPEGRYLPASASSSLYHQPHQLIRSCKYLAPAQDLLNEVCSLGGDNTGTGGRNKKKLHDQWEEGGSSSSSTWNQSLPSLDILELQKRKAKLLSMLEEVDRRYRKYCEQMRAVVSSFEGMAGEGAATVYSAMASKAMSRHFRCLRDGIVAQIRVTKKAMGEKELVNAPGTTRGETPRLKLLDQCLRQQKAMGVMENHPWRPQRGLPERSVTLLRAWLFEHFLHPYPSDVDKHILARQTGLSRSQVSNWFINARVRLWKPMVEEMYLEETREKDNQSSSHGITVGHKDQAGRPNPNQNQNPNGTINHELRMEDQKPAPVQLVNDSESLSSIINSSHNSDHRRGLLPTGGGSKTPHHHHHLHHQHQQQQQFDRPDNFGMVDLDFSSSYNNDCSSHQNFGNGVSLTLGLQQHNGGGMNLSFSSASAQSNLFISREPMDNCQPVQFSILEGDAQNLPYRNLMEAQLLHDLAG